MATSNQKRVRYTLEVPCSSSAVRDALEIRMATIRKKLTPRGSRALNNFEFLTALMDLVPVSPQLNQVPYVAPSRSSFLTNSGVVSHDTVGKASPPRLFVVEENTFSDLCNNLPQLCPCSGQWKLQSITQVGHVLRAQFQCTKFPQHIRTWSSSRFFGGQYLVNQKLVHSFTVAGMLPVQYMKFGELSGIGRMSKGYIYKMYRNRKYTECVHLCADESMQKAVEEVKKRDDYATNGEWVMTDARHDSTANAYHSTVVCISGSNKKVIGICTKSRKEHGTAQTRELACTEELIPQVLSRGLDVREVAHDYATSVSSYITNDLKLLNSYDTWHGTKNVAKEVKKIARGAQKWEGTKWFKQLSDKCKSTKTHLYWSMKNCNGDADKLRRGILNVVTHYKGDHSCCNSSSDCTKSVWTPNKQLLTDQKAILAYEKSLKSTLIFRNAESFCRCRDTFWVESFNHQLLTYTPKRIHFGSATFRMRLSLAVLDWNENSQRHFTSQRMVTDMRRPDRRTPMKCLVKKTFKFAHAIWDLYVCQNLEDIRVVDDDESSDVDTDIDDEFDFEDDGMNLDDDDDDDEDDNDDELDTA